MKYATFVIRCALALPISALIASMAWYLWLQEEILGALDELSA